MSRHYYCSECGTELILNRKALRNKQVVIDILNPHTCDPEHKNIANIQDDERAPTQYESEVRKESNLRKGTLTNSDDNIFQDHRDKKFLREGLRPVTSTAPFNILSQVKGSATSRPEVPSEIDDEEA